MNAKEKTRLSKKFNIQSYGGQTYGEGLFDGLKTAEKYYEKRLRA